MAQVDRVDQIADDFWKSVRSGAHKERGLSGREFLLETVFNYAAEKEEQEMSKDWNQQELEAASAAMQEQGFMGYDEFAETLKNVMMEGMGMKAMFNLKGAERKPLVQAVSEITGEKSKYRGMPSCIYEVGRFRIGKDGELTAEQGTDRGAFERLLDQLASKGFEGELVLEDKAAEPPVEPETLPEIVLPAEALEFSTDVAAADEPGWPGLVIQVPMDGFTESKLENLRKLIDSKHHLIQKALGAVDLIFSECDGTLCFPWFDRELDAFEIKTYTHFISALCETAKRQQRVVATEKDVPSERFTFRIFLLKLGFAGPEYKDERALLYKNLGGDCAFNSTDKRDAHAAKWKGIRQEQRAAEKLSNQEAAAAPDAVQPDEPEEAADVEATEPEVDTADADSIEQEAAV